MRKGRKRLSMDIPIGIHRYIKERAKQHNCTITKYILRLLIAQLSRDKDYNK